MTPQVVLVLSTFLAVSSATLLIYLALAKDVGRPHTRGGDLADTEHDPIPSSASPKALAPRSVRIAPAVPRFGGGGRALVVPIASVAVTLMIGGFYQFARTMIRQQFERVVSEITTDNGFWNDFDNHRPNLPEFRGLTIPNGQFSLKGLGKMGNPAGIGRVGAPAPGPQSGQSSPNGSGGMRATAGFGGGGAPAPGHRASFRIR